MKVDLDEIERRRREYLEELRTSWGKPPQECFKCHRGHWVEDDERGHWRCFICGNRGFWYKGEFLDSWKLRVDGRASEDRQ